MPATARSTPATPNKPASDAPAVDGVRLEKATPRHAQYRRFGETARFDAIGPDGAPLGSVWRGRDYNGAGVWMVDPPDGFPSFPDPAVVSGYARTTKAGALAALLTWHRIPAIDAAGLTFRATHEQRPPAEPPLYITRAYAAPCAAVPEGVMTLAVRYETETMHHVPTGWRASRWHAGEKRLVDGGGAHASPVEAVEALFTAYPLGDDAALQPLKAPA